MINLLLKKFAFLGSALALTTFVSRGVMAQQLPAQQPATQQPATQSSGEQPAAAPEPLAAPQPSPQQMPPAAPAPAPASATQPYAPPGYGGAYPGTAEATPARRPVVMDYIDGQPVPPGYTVVEQRRKGLIITGSILFGISYGISLAVAAGSEYSGDYGWLALPVVGPIIASAQLSDDCEGDEFSCDEQGAERGFLMLDALTQAAGATLLTVGLVVRKKVLVQNMAVNFSIQPAVFAGHSRGLELRATF